MPNNKDRHAAFPGCEDLSGKARFECGSQKLWQFINDHFNTALKEKLGIEGKVRIQAAFFITENGKIEVVGAKSDYPQLNKEAIRVLNLLPNWIPALKDGKFYKTCRTFPLILQ